MAFSDPQSITIDGTAYSLARTYTGTSQGRFVTADGTRQIEIIPPSGGVTSSARRHSIARLRNTKIASDPLTAVNVRVGDLISLNINRPSAGFTDAEIEKEVVGFFAWLTAGTNANLKKLIAGEN